MYLLKTGIVQMNKLQIELALKVLKNIQTCIRNRDTYIPGVGEYGEEGYVSPFNLTKSFGICWHVYAHTPPDLGLDMDFLHPVFLELGYTNKNYPVESTFMPDGNDDDFSHYQYKVNPYDGYWGTDHSGVEREDCSIRRKLVDELVQYFETKLGDTV